MASRLTYKCKISAKYILNDKVENIPNSSIKYIMIENLYESRYMPVVYLSLSIKEELYTSMIENEKNAKFYLRVQKYNVNSNNPIYKDHINGQFTYILPTSNPNYSEVLNTEETMEDSYKTITLGLISMKIMNDMKISWNGIYSDIDQNTMIAKALEGLNTVLTHPKYNAKFGTLIIPPLPSRTQLIKFIFTKNPFYDTQYMFFMDFDRAYLLDLTGEPIKAGDGQLDTILINIEGVDDSVSYSEGISTINDTYQFYVNPANTNISPNKTLDKLSNQIIFVDEDTTQVVDLNVNKNFDTTVKQSFKRSDDPILYKNMIEANTVIIELIKENIDSSYITPNKRYMIDTYEDYDEYRGKYTLLYRKDVITNINNEFGLSTSIGLKKVGNISKIGTTRTKKVKKKNSRLKVVHKGK